MWFDYYKFRLNFFVVNIKKIFVVWCRNLIVFIFFGMSNILVKYYKFFFYVIIYIGIYWFKCNLIYIVKKEEIRKYENVFVERIYLYLLYCILGLFLI